MTDEEVQQRIAAAKEKLGGIMAAAIVNGDLTIKAWEYRALAWTLFCLWLCGVEYSYDPESGCLVWQPTFSLDYVTITLKVSE